MNQTPNTPNFPPRRLVGALGFSVALVACVVAALVVDFGAQTGVARDPVEVAILPADARLVVETVAEAALGQADGTGSFSGTILYDGAPPKRATLDTSSKNPQVCSATPLLAEDLVVNPENKGIENVFVYLRRAPAGAKVPKPSADPIVFDQKACRFIPHCLPVQVGSKLLVKSDDPVPHNTHTFPVRNDGFNQVIGANNRDGVELKYSKTETLPTEVKCDFHPWMKAYHLILEHPYMAVTDADGKFTVANVPPGKHEFVIWQEKAGYLIQKYEVEVKAGEKVNKELKFPPAKFTAFNGPPASTIVIGAAQGR